MRFFNIDLHVSVIADVAGILAELGHSVDDWCLSGHHWVLGKEKHEVPLLGDWTSLSPELCDRFYEAYRDELSDYDGFICCYPASFAMLYERFDKPTIAVNCVRYEIPFTQRPDDWRRLDEFIQRRVSERKLWWVCNNKGDAWYVNHFTGIEPRWIPNLCEYVDQKWTGTADRFVLYGRTTGWLPGVSPQLYVHSDSAALQGPDGHYSWEKLYQQRGIIHVPYHNGSMSTFEHYTANAPLFFPSKGYLKRLYRHPAAAMLRSLAWPPSRELPRNLYRFRHAPIRVLSELTFYKVYGLPEPREPGNPNNLSDDAVLDRWLETFDFYDDANMRHIQYFDSFSELEELMRTVDADQISQQMAADNERRKNLVYGQWHQVLNEIEDTTG